MEYVLIRKSDKNTLFPQERLSNNIDQIKLRENKLNLKVLIIFPVNQKQVHETRNTDDDISYIKGKKKILYA